MPVFLAGKKNARRNPATGANKILHGLLSDNKSVGKKDVTAIFPVDINDLIFSVTQ